MLVTNEVFLWVNGILISSILALIGSIWKIRGEIYPLCHLAKRIQAQALDDWFSQRGINIEELGSKKKSGIHNSLSPEKAAERDELITRGKESGLSEDESIRLKQLLEEDARTDFAHGVFNFLAFVAVLALISAIVKSLSKS